MLNTVKKFFGYGEEEIIRKDQSVKPTIVEATETDDYDNDLSNTTTRKNFNPKLYYRHNQKFYRRRKGFDLDFDIDDEIIDLLLIELLLSAFDNGDVDLYADVISEAPEPYDNILDVDINTIPVEDTLSMVDTPATVEMEPATYTPPPTPSYSSPSTGSSYSSGSSDSDSYSSSSSSSDSYSSSSSDSSD